MTELKVSIPVSGVSYKILAGSGIAPEKINNHFASGGFTVADGNVADIYPRLMPSGRLYRYAASEDNKTLASLEDILKWLRDEGALRDGALMAVGGGITGDAAGFAAAVYMRGIKIIQMPTTLLAMVDSSVGGKTGVNFGGLKNNVGAFHQPSEVIIDVDFLRTLSDGEFLNGLAESIKIAAVADADFFRFLKENRRAVLDRDEKIMETVVSRSCALKAAVVEADEKESGLRKLLNFGHTIAHAIETDSCHVISHGRAVAMGMAYETEYAFRRGIADKSVLDAVRGILTKYGYDLEYRPQNADTFLKALSKDKKATRSGISLALTGKGMTGKIVNGVMPEELCALFGR